MSKINQTLCYLTTEGLDFPDVNQALDDPNGLLALGGDLSPQRIINAYTHGVFPWYSDDQPLMWWSPNPRAIIPIENIKINRTLKKFLNKAPYRVSINMAFEQVIKYCADAPFRKQGTWIVKEMIDAYCELHKLGVAHSIEVWDGEQLIGGLYGVAIKGHFSGESMFYIKPNASKVALITLANLMASQQLSFIDCQLTNPFLESMGCIEISRAEFISLKNGAISTNVDNSLWIPRELTINI